MITRNSALASIVQIKQLRTKSLHFGGKARGGVARPRAHALGKPIERPPLPAFEQARLRAKIAAITCSEPWTESAAASAEAHGIHPKLAKLAHQLAQRGIYPPKPDPGPDELPRIGAVRMRRCHACGRIVPPNNLASYKLLRLCDDCRIEPETDLDDPANSTGFSRSPGERGRTLVEESVIDDDITPAREQLLRIGLSDSQITALALANEGYTLRAIAKLCGWRASYVHKLLQSATQVLRSSGLALPKTWGTAHPNRAYRVSPNVLDAMSDRVI